MKKIDLSLEERLENLIRSMGYEFVGCEMGGHNRNMIFRIYVDKKNGISIDECSEISRQVSALLDVEDPIKSHYTLEVSSPGIDRPLFTIEDYRKQIGKTVKVRLHKPISGRRQYKGLLSKVVDADIYLLIEDVKLEIVLPFSAIEKANLVGDIRL